jgi:hypothetical protein
MGVFCLDIKTTIQRSCKWVFQYYDVWSTSFLQVTQKPTLAIKRRWRYGRLPVETTKSLRCMHTSGLGWKLLPASYLCPWMTFSYGLIKHVMIFCTLNTWICSFSTPSVCEIMKRHKTALVPALLLSYISVVVPTSPTLHLRSCTYLPYVCICSVTTLSKRVSYVFFIKYYYDVLKMEDDGMDEACNTCQWS